MDATSEVVSRPPDSSTAPWILLASMTDQCSAAGTSNVCYLTAMDATSDESRPPESSTPSGASDISRFTTAATSESWIASRLAGALGTRPGCSQAGLYQRSHFPVLLR